MFEWPKQWDTQIKNRNRQKQVIHCNTLIDKSSLPHSELCPGTCDINSIIPKELFKFIAVMNF